MTPKIKHGTHYAYSVRKCRCKKCTAANSAAKSAWRKRHPEWLERHLEYKRKRRAAKLKA